MGAPLGQRQPWEYADEPEVGRDVPITSEPRDEAQPGVPVKTQRTGKEPDRDRTGRTELREVRAADPNLSPETNGRLTAELREVIGAEHVSVPADRPLCTALAMAAFCAVVAYALQH